MSARCAGAKRGRVAGFSLLEMLAVVLLTAMVFGVAVDFYLDLSRAGLRASNLTREARRAAAVLDRVARDLEAAVLVVKPEEMDPLEHPWLFLAESEATENGADRLKFVTRLAARLGRSGAGSDLGFVVWMTAAGADGRLELRRWSAPTMPASLDRSFPNLDDTLVVTRGLGRFAVRLLDAESQWQSAWDSSQVAQSSELPFAAEIEVSFAPDPNDVAAAPVETPLDVASAAQSFVRRVALPVRPIDLQELTEDEDSEAEAGKDEDGDGIPDDEQDDVADADDESDESSCITVSECLARNPQVAAQAEAAGLSSVLQSIGGQCFSDVKGNLPPGISLAGCE